MLHTDSRFKHRPKGRYAADRNPERDHEAPNYDSARAPGISPDRLKPWARLSRPLSMTSGTRPRPTNTTAHQRQRRLIASLMQDSAIARPRPRMHAFRRSRLSLSPIAHSHTQAAARVGGWPGSRFSHPSKPRMPPRADRILHAGLPACRPFHASAFVSCIRCLSSTPPHNTLTAAQRERWPASVLELARPVVTRPAA